MDFILIIVFLIGVVMMVVGIVDQYQNHSFGKGLLQMIGAWFGFNLILLVIASTVVGEVTNTIKYHEYENRHGEDTIHNTYSIEINGNSIEVPVTQKQTTYDIVCRVTVERSYRMALFLGDDSFIDLRKPCSEVSEQDYVNHIKPIFREL